MAGLCSAAEGDPMLKFIAFFAVYLVVVYVVFPRLGIKPG